MAIRTESELQKRWRDRWSSFLQLVEDAETAEEACNVLRGTVIIGNVERKIAGGHEGREILELLQNARDAVWSDDPEHGRVTSVSATKGSWSPTVVEIIESYRDMVVADRDYGEGGIPEFVENPNAYYRD